MDATQKLARFMDEVKAGTDAQIAADLAAAQQEADTLIAEAQARCQAEAELTVSAAKAKVDAKYQKQLSQVGYRGKTALLSRRQGLLMQLFAELRRKLTAFTETEEYTAWMTGLLKQKAPEENAVILLREKDMQMQAALAKAAGVPCTFQQDPSIVLGGLSVVSADGRRCANHTLDEAFSSQLRNFYRDHRIGGETEV